MKIINISQNFHSFLCDLKIKNENCTLQQLHFFHFCDKLSYIKLKRRNTDEEKPYCGNRGTFG